MYVLENDLMFCLFVQLIVIFYVFDELWKIICYKKLLHCEKEKLCRNAVKLLRKIQEYFSHHFKGLCARTWFRAGFVLRFLGLSVSESYWWSCLVDMKLQHDAQDSNSNTKTTTNCDNLTSGVDWFGYLKHQCQYLGVSLKLQYILWILLPSFGWSSALKFSITSFIWSLVVMVWYSTWMWHLWYKHETWTVLD